MNKGYILLLFLLSTVFSYGQEISLDQEIIFEKNVSYASRELKFIQKLNKTSDTLILETESSKIKRVDILNDDYLESINVDSIKCKISLKKLPIGSFVIQARIGRSWIVMYLDKKDPRTITSELVKSYNIKIQASVPTLQKKASEPLIDENTMYWVVYESNSSFSSVKTMSLKYVDEIHALMSRIKLELKTEDGKYNKLMVYEIYDKAEFLQKQLRNNKYYKSEESDLFNVYPLYNSDNETVNESKS